MGESQTITRITWITCEMLITDPIFSFRISFRFVVCTFVLRGKSIFLLSGSLYRGFHFMTTLWNSILYYILLICTSYKILQHTCEGSVVQPQQKK